MEFSHRSNPVICWTLILKSSLYLGQEAREKKWERFEQTSGGALITGKTLDARVNVRAHHGDDLVIVLRLKVLTSQHALMDPAL